VCSKAGECGVMRGRIRNMPKNIYKIIKIIDNKTLFVKSESLPFRCEICHQNDYFDPLSNKCLRCNKAVIQQFSIEPNIIFHKIGFYTFFASLVSTFIWFIKEIPSAHGLSIDEVNELIIYILFGQIIFPLITFRNNYKWKFLFRIILWNAASIIGLLMGTFINFLFRDTIYLSDVKITNYQFDIFINRAWHYVPLGIIGGNLVGSLKVWISSLIELRRKQKKVLNFK
jgi:hypothetical protein